MLFFSEDIRNILPTFYYKEKYKNSLKMPEYMCITCNKSFGKSQHLERHERTHTGITNEYKQNLSRYIL